MKTININTKRRTKALINSIKRLNLLQGIVYYLLSGKLRAKATVDFNSIIVGNSNLYYAYTSLRRSPKMKVIAHFNEDGPTIQKVIEELLLEVVVVK